MITTLQTMLTKTLNDRRKEAMTLNFPRAFAELHL